MYKCAEDSSCKRADQPAIQRGQTVSKLEKVTNALDERGLGVAPREPNVDDHRNPAIVNDSLWVEENAVRRRVHILTKDGKNTLGRSQQLW